MKVHLVLVTKYRPKAFTADILARLNTIVEELLESNYESRNRKL
ncbi:transposase [Sphaerospermopsis aphanizomenoides]|nr:transposase [Sphaerospermopsis aphanizomenoides]